MENTKKDFFCLRQVKESKDGLLKERLKTLIFSKGMSEKDFYKTLGISRQYWYMISWGLCSVPIHLKIKIAKMLETDTINIWRMEAEE